MLSTSSSYFSNSFSRFWRYICFVCIYLTCPDLFPRRRAGFRSRTAKPPCGQDCFVMSGSGINETKTWTIKTYIILTSILFLIETLIAIYLKTGFIRHTFGDFLCVILLYCFFKSFIEGHHFKIAISVLVIAASSKASLIC